VPPQFIRDMFNEHNLVLNARVWFKAWNSGNEIDTTPEREWAFVVGTEGLDKSTWTFVIERAAPQVLDGMMVHDRNAKSLAELLEEEARQVDEGERLSPAEVVAVRLYTGVYCLVWFGLFGS
jgi:hypothetical protein